MLRYFSTTTTVGGVTDTGSTTMCNKRERVAFRAPQPGVAAVVPADQLGTAPPAPGRRLPLQATAAVPPLPRTHRTLRSRDFRIALVDVTAGALLMGAVI